MDPNVNKFWDYVKSQFPDARFVYFYLVGELQFYPNGTLEAQGGKPYSCVKECGEYVIRSPK